MASKAPQEVLSLSKCIGSFIQHWGFKKIHGQIWTLIFLSKSPLNSTVITKRLQVSKALVSLAIKDLLKYKVIEVTEKKNKEIYFRSNPEIFKVICDILNSREKVMISNTREAVNTLQKNAQIIQESNFPVDPKKVEEMGQMIDLAQASLQWMMQTLEHPAH